MVSLKRRKNSMPATYASALQQTYATIAQGYENKHRFDVDEQLLSTFQSLLRSQATVLDLGGGSGRDAKWMVDHGLCVTLFDLSAELLIFAKQKVPEASIVQGDMTELPFTDASFDAVWANASLLHLTKQECPAVVKKIYALMRPGGIFFCSVKEGYGETVVSDYKYGSPMQRFFSFYQEKELKTLLTQSGFTVITLNHAQTSSGQLWLRAFSKK